MNTLKKTTINNSVALYIAGDLFYKVSLGVASDFFASNDKSERYLKNKCEKAAKEAQSICKPLHQYLLKNGVDLSNTQQVDRLIDLISDIAALDGEEFKRVNGILQKVKSERNKLMKVG